jgi:hypothetical protein
VAHYDRRGDRCYFGTDEHICVHDELTSGLDKQMCS